MILVLWGILLLSVASQQQRYDPRYNLRPDPRQGPFNPQRRYVAANGVPHSHERSYAYILQQNQKIRNDVNPLDDYAFNPRVSNKPTKQIPKQTSADEKLLAPQMFKEKYFNSTYSDWKWRAWNKEGVLMAVTTDKPVYKPGELLQARLYFFNYTDKAPVKWEDFYPSLEVIDSNDQVVFTKPFDYNNKCDSSSMVYEYQIPKTAKGGVYFIKANEYSLPPTEIKVRIREYQQKSLVTFDYSQESYNPGDQVEGKLTLRPSNNEPIPVDANFQLKTSAGETKSNLAIDFKGFGYFTFKVPNDWKDGTISVSYTVNSGGSSSTKTDIVTVVQKDSIAIDFTGESGKIINNACNKIYFEAFADDSKAEHIDISNAQIVEISSSKSEKVLSSGVSTQFHGRGYFEVCTQENTKYILRYKGVDHEIDIKKHNSELDGSSIKIEENFLIKAKNTVISNGDAIDLTIVSSNPNEKRNMILSISQKTIVLHSEKVSVNSKETRVTIPGSSIKLPNGGVVSVSLYDTKDPIAKDSNRNLDELPPPSADISFPYSIIANRLMFILPSTSLEVKLTTDKKFYSPGETVDYEVSVVDRTTGRAPTGDVLVALGVSDLSAFLEVESKRLPPSLTSKVYLEKEIKVTKEYEFLNANEFLDFVYNKDGKKNESIQKLELLLGTQKWRLFMFDPNYSADHSADLYGEDKLKAYLMKNLLVKNSGPIYAMNDMVMEMAPMMMARAGAPPPAPKMAKFKEVGKPVPMASPTPPPAPGMAEEVAEEDESQAPQEENNKKKDADRAESKEAKNVLFTKFVLCKDGKYKSSFKLNDVITKFQFTVDAVSAAGVYGVLTHEFDSTKDFFLQANVPFFLTSQDKLNVPVVVHNNKAKDVVVNLSVSTTLTNNELETVFSETRVTISKKSSKQVVLKLNAKKMTAGDFKISIKATCENDCDDTITASSKIIGRGFNVVRSQSGFIGYDGAKFNTEVALPVTLSPTFEEGSFEVKSKIYTSQLSHIYEALEKLIRDPHGCFEQTSSTTYPLVMALMLMQNLPEKNDKVTQMMIEGKQKLKAGYERLLTFETSTGGYEWFGSSPGHEALTAYGLMQFHEMKQVLSNVDQSMIDRVTKWILERRDGSGSFKMSEHGLDSFGTPPAQLSDAYILWVLTSIGQNAGLENEIKAVIEKAKASGDSYLNALVANILYNVGRNNEAQDIARILKSHQDAQTGEVQRKETSITRSSGVSLNVETTALSILAWMKDPSGEFASSIELGVKYIISSIKDGKYGSTQGTILSLKVLVEFLKNSKLEGKGTFEIQVDGKLVKSIDFDNKTDTATLDFSEDLKSYLASNDQLFKKESTHTITLALKNFSGNESKFRLSYLIEALFKDLSPQSNAKSELAMTLQSQGGSVKPQIGDITTYSLKVTNKDAANGKGMLIAIVRVPSCQEVNFNALERLQNENMVAYFEVLNGNTDVVLYWRSINPGETKDVKLTMTQTVAGDQCIFRPSKAYLYYDEDGSEVWSS